MLLKPEKTEHVSKSQVLGKFILTRAALNDFTLQLFPQSSATKVLSGFPPLSKFIDSLMRQTQTPLFILILALLYLKRLKEFHPGCRGSPGSSHRLLYTSLIIASKYTCDDTFDNNAWATASKGLFSNEETNRMEQEMLQYLDFIIFVKRTEWDNHLVSTIQYVNQVTSKSNVAIPLNDETIHVTIPSKPGILRQISSSSTMFDPEEDTIQKPDNGNLLYYGMPTRPENALVNSTSEHSLSAAMALPSFD